jgi:hypothetical protein
LADPPGLRVLLTNAWLDRTGGTESVVRDVALGLLRRGHRPTIYSPHLGAPAKALHTAGVAVTSDLATIREAPDVIHGQHFVQTAEALLHFPDTPAVQHCHAWAFWQEAPVLFPQIHRYLAVDEAVRDRLVQMEGIAPEQVEILHNCVDLGRMPPRPQPPAERPTRALAFTKHRAQLPLIAEACARHGVQLDVLGAGGDRTVLDPEKELVGYDLVFATARMALEALVAGCAVVVCDSRGLAGMVDRAGFPRLRRLNFGLRSLTRPVTVEALSAEIARYDAGEAAEVARLARTAADLQPMLDRIEALHREALQAPAPEASEVRAATLRFLKVALPRARDNRWPWMEERETLARRIDELERELAAARAQALRGAP